MPLTLKISKFIFEINMLKHSMICKAVMMVYKNHNLTNVSTAFIVVYKRLPIIQLTYHTKNIT
jgi:hypothetical protein